MPLLDLAMPDVEHGLARSRPDCFTQLAQNLGAVRRKVADASAAFGGGADSVTLIAASKTVDTVTLRAAIGLGQRVFGENRVQEGKLKWPALIEAHDDLELHLLGPLQSNKARDAVALFHVIQTVDRSSVAHAIAKECDRQGRRPKVYVQVNTGREPQKGGAPSETVSSLVRVCREDCGLDVVGLMCIPPAGLDPSGDFALLRSLSSDVGLGLLSMGMSDDYALAIEHGATHVRVGSAIFGSRPPVHG